jgi:hypothetical protein
MVLCWYSPLDGSVKGGKQSKSGSVLPHAYGPPNGVENSTVEPSQEKPGPLSARNDGATTGMAGAGCKGQ